MLERYLVEYCSPTLASIKTANLFNVPYASWKELDGQLESLKQQFAEKYGIISIGIFGSEKTGRDSADLRLQKAEAERRFDKTRCGRIFTNIRI